MSSEGPVHNPRFSPEGEPDATQQAMYQQRPGANTPPAISGTPLPGDQGALLMRLRAQVEYYFSPQNLSRDMYLRNMLSSSLGEGQDDISPSSPARCMVPIDVITNFPKVQNICASFGHSLPEPPHVLLARALEGSSIVVISPDFALIGPALQQLPPTGIVGPPPRAPQQPPFQHPHQFQQQQQQQQQQQRMMMVQVPHMPPPQGDGNIPLVHQQMAYATHPHRLPLHRVESPSSNSLESTPSSYSKESIIVVLSHVPDEAEGAEVLAALTTESVQPMSAESVGSNTWYIVFANESDAKSAILASEERSIAGLPVKARMKSDVPPSMAVSATSASGVSLSTMSEPQRLVPGAGVHYGSAPQMVGTIMGRSPPGAYSMTQVNPSAGHQPPAIHGAPSPHEMYPPPSGGPHYPAAPPYGMHPMPVGSIPPGQHFSPYYSHQHMYPYYIQQQGQQQLQPFPPPPHHNMSPRYPNAGIPPPPPPRYQGLGGVPPIPYPYQGMQQYVPGDGYGHYHGVQLHRQHSGGMTGRVGDQQQQRKKNEQGKKKKGKQQKRYLYFVGGSESDGAVRRIRNDIPRDYHSNYQNNESSSSLNVSNSPVGDNQHNRGGKMRPRRGDNVDPMRRGQSASAPSVNRNQKNNRLSGNDTGPSNADGEKKESRGDRKIFSAADFPGLGAGCNESDNTPSEAKDQGVPVSAKLEAKKFSGYAEALRNKRGDEFELTSETNMPALTKDDKDSSSRQTEAMEREILSEFHDLSLMGDGGAKAGDRKCPLHSEVVDNTHCQEVAITLPSLPDTAPHEGAKPFTKATKTDLPILPRAPEPSLDDDTDANFSNGPGIKSKNYDGVKGPPLPYTEPVDKNPLPAQKIESETGRKDVSDNERNAEKQAIIDEPKPAGAWGSKRLFADVIK